MLSEYEKGNKSSIKSSKDLREKKKLAACRGEEDEDAEGGGLAGSHYWPGAGQEGKIMGL